MSSRSTNNFPAMEMARCPNCGYAIEQLGARTNCSKCGKQITVRCLSCQTNNPPIFQFCMKCGVDYRLTGVEYYRKQLAKLDFDLTEHERLVYLQKRASLLRQVWQIIGFIVALIVGISCCLIVPIAVATVIALALLAFAHILVKLFGNSWSLRFVGMPPQLAQQWRQLCLIAEKQLLQKLEIEQSFAYYQRELNQYRQKKS